MSDAEVLGENGQRTVREFDEKLLAIYGDAGQRDVRDWRNKFREAMLLAGGEPEVWRLDAALDLLDGLRQEMLQFEASEPRLGELTCFLQQVHLGVLNARSEVEPL